MERTPFVLHTYHRTYSSFVRIVEKKKKRKTHFEKSRTVYSCGRAFLKNMDPERCRKLAPKLAFRPRTCVTLRTKLRHLQEPCVVSAHREGRDVCTWWALSAEHAQRASSNRNPPKQYPLWYTIHRVCQLTLGACVTLVTEKPFSRDLMQLR